MLLFLYYLDGQVMLSIILPSGNQIMYSKNMTVHISYEGVVFIQASRFHVAIRYDKRADRFLAFVHLTCIRILLA